MISPKSLEELADLVEQDGKKVFLLLRIGVACHYILSRLARVGNKSKSSLSCRSTMVNCMELAKL